MRKNQVFIVLIVAIIGSSCNNSRKDATSRNNLIVSDQIEFYRLNDRMFDLFSQDASEELCTSQYDSLTGYLKLIMAKYDTIPPFDKDPALDMAMKDFLAQYQKLVFNEYREILHIVIKPRYLMEASDLKILDSLYLVIDNKQSDIDKNFAAAQEDFCTKHGVEFE
jgi:hypothetical protein